MLGSSKDFKFPTTLTKVSLPMLSSLEKQTRPSTDTALESARDPAASYQKDICFVTSSEHNYRSTRKTIKLRLPPTARQPCEDRERYRDIRPARRAKHTMPAGTASVKGKVELASPIYSSMVHRLPHPHSHGCRH
jgi:hypothetical protein